MVGTESFPSFLPAARDARLRLSGRALARAASGREFPLSTLSMVERGPRPTIAHVSSRPPSHSVRGVFPRTASRSGTPPCGREPSATTRRASVCSLTSLRTVRRLLQPSRRACACQAPRLWVRTCGPARPPCAQRASLQQGGVVPSCVAWRPHPPVCRPPPHFPAGLVLEAVLGMRGSSCRVSTPAGLLLLSCPGLPPAASAGSLARAHPHAAVPALALGEREATLGTSHAPAIRSARGPHVDGSCVRARDGPPGGAPPGLSSPSSHLCSACLRLVHPGCQPARHPQVCRR